MEARRPERFVSVDVADAGDERLIEQEGLQPAPARSKESAEPSQREVVAEWLGPRSGENRRPARLGHGFTGDRIDRIDADPAELANVAEPQLATIIEREDGPHVLIGPGRGGNHEQLPGHLQVDRHDRAARQADHELLAATADRLDASARYGGTDRLWGMGSQGPWPRCRGILDRGAKDQATQVARDRLYLRQLGHVSLRATRPPRRAPRPAGRSAPSIPSRRRP